MVAEYYHADGTPHFSHYWDIPETEYDMQNYDGKGVILFGLHCIRCNEDGGLAHYHLFGLDGESMTMRDMGIFLSWGSVLGAAYAYAVAVRALQAPHLSSKLWMATCNSALLDNAVGQVPANFIVGHNDLTH